MAFPLPTHTNSRCHYMALRRKLLAGSCSDTPNYINDAIARPFPMRRRKKKNSLLSKLHSWRTVKTLHCAPAHRCINTPSLYHAVLSKIRNYMFFKHTHTHTHTQLAVRARFHVTTTLTLVFGEVTLKSVSKHSLHSYVPWHVAHLSCTLRMILRGGNISSSVMLRSLFYLVSLPLQS